MQCCNGVEEQNSPKYARQAIWSSSESEGLTLTQLTDQYEGTIIRTFRRLQELIRQMTAAAKAIGNNELEKKFTDALALLERQNSVIFCSSLYL
jgi:superfamily II RNA helicase